MEWSHPRLSLRPAGSGGGIGRRPPARERSRQSVPLASWHSLVFTLDRCCAQLSVNFSTTPPTPPPTLSPCVGKPSLIRPVRAVQTLHGPRAAADDVVIPELRLREVLFLRPAIRLEHLDA